MLFFCIIAFIHFSVSSIILSVTPYALILPLMTCIHFFFGLPLPPDWLLLFYNPYFPGYLIVIIFLDMSIHPLCHFPGHVHIISKHIFIPNSIQSSNASTLARSFLQRFIFISYLLFNARHKDPYVMAGNSFPRLTSCFQRYFLIAQKSCRCFSPLHPVTVYPTNYVIRDSLFVCTTDATILPFNQ